MTKKPGSGYELFKQRQFRELWTANFVLNLGQVMFLLAAAWAMTSLTENALLVTMVQTAVSLPFIFLSIPVGVMADVFGYRRLLLIAQTWMVLPVGALALLAWRGQLTPWLLLSLLFLTGLGMAIQQSTWKPMLYDLMPRDQTVAAVSLNSLNGKVAQAAGPLIGGFLMGLGGAAAVFAFRTVAHVVMLLTVWRVPKRAHERGEPHSFSEVKQSFGEGWRFVRGSRAAHGPLLRTAMFMIPCAGMVSLLPLEAKDNIQTEVIGFGGLLTALAVGTATGVALMPWFQRHFGVNAIGSAALATFSVAVLGISRWDSMFLDAAFLLVAGFTWGILGVSHQASLHVASPDDMRGRLTSFYALTVQGSFAVGSLLFGLFAEHRGVSASILLSGFVVMSGLLLVRRFPLSDAVKEVREDS